MVILCLNIYPQFIVSGIQTIRMALYQNKLVRKLPPLRCFQLSTCAESTDPERSSSRVIDYYCLVSSLVCCNSVVLPLYPALDMIMWYTKIQMFEAQATVWCCGVADRRDRQSLSAGEWTDRQTDVETRSRDKKLSVTLKDFCCLTMDVGVENSLLSCQFSAGWIIPRSLKDHTSVCACFSLLEYTWHQYNTSLHSFDCRWDQLSYFRRLLRKFTANVVLHLLLWASLVRCRDLV